MDDGKLLEPPQLARYADAIVKASLGIGRGDTLFVQAQPAHRELAVAVVEAGYRAGATLVELQYYDPLAARARLLNARDEALGVLSPWAKRRLQELAKPNAARVGIGGEGEPGYLDGVPNRRIATESARLAAQTAAFRRADLNMQTRWTGVNWPTDHWAGQVYPALPVLKAKRKLARDLLRFCRLTDADGTGSSGWLRHVRALSRRSAKLTRLGLVAVELRGPGTALDVRLSPGTRWLGGCEETAYGAMIAANMPTEETFTSPAADGVEGAFRCTIPLSLRGRMIEGLRGELRGGRLVRLDADDKSDRDFVATYLDSDPLGNGRKLGEVALVDATSRIGQSGRIYFDTLLDENAAAHIAFGAGFRNTRTTKPVRGVNDAAVHLDVMIGTPDFEVTGIDAKGRRVPVIRDGLFQL